MDRQRTIGLAALFLILLGLALFWTRIPSEAPTPAVPPVASAPSATSAPTPSAAASLEAAVETALTPDETGGEGFDRLLDGSKAPPLPASAPQQVTFGVVVFGYQGAQFAAAGSRSKDQAKQKALAAVEEAKRDFSAAVSKGDHGSAANAGRMPRGMLEPAAEYTLFSLGKGEVSAAPVDTPRGFWIVRRVD